MATKDISDAEVILAYIKAKETDEFPEAILHRETGQALKVCFRAMERACNRDYIEYGNSLRSGWVTNFGYEHIFTLPILSTLILDSQILQVVSGFIEQVKNPNQRSQKVMLEDKVLLYMLLPRLPRDKILPGYTERHPSRFEDHVDQFGVTELFVWFARVLQWKKVFGHGFDYFTSHQDSWIIYGPDLAMGFKLFNFKGKNNDGKLSTKETQEASL